MLSSPLPRPPQGPKALLLLLAAAASPSVAQAKRVALVIGIVIAGAQQIVLLDACRNNPFPQCARDKFGLWLPRLSLVGKADRTLLIANATLSGNLAADGDPGAHSPFASALIKNFNEHPRLYFGDLLNMTAADVRVASRGAQIPEITARGGSPRICLDVEGSPRSTSSRCWLTS